VDDVLEGTGSGLTASCLPSGSEGSPERVYRWVPDATGTAVVETCGGTTGFETELVVRRAACVDGTELGCGISTCPDGGSRGLVPVEAGTEYFVIVGGYGTSRGPFTLTVTPPGATSPECAATIVPPAGGAVMADPAGAGNSIAPSCSSTFTFGG